MQHHNRVHSPTSHTMILPADPHTRARNPLQGGITPKALSGSPPCTPRHRLLWCASARWQCSRRTWHCHRTSLIRFVRTACTPSCNEASHATLAVCTFGTCHSEPLRRERQLPGSSRVGLSEAVTAYAHNQPHMHNRGTHILHSPLAPLTLNDSYIPTPFRIISLGPSVSTAHLRCTRSRATSQTRDGFSFSKEGVGALAPLKTQQRHRALGEEDSCGHPRRTVTASQAPRMVSAAPAVATRP
jgi:hypothetical protein